MTATPTRVRLFAALVALCVAGAAAAVVVALGAGGGERSAGGAEVLPAAHASGERLALFRTEDARGHVAAVPVSDPAGPRTVLPLECERVYFSAGRGLCLARGGGFAAGYEAKIFGPDLKVTGAVDVPGVPSRARVSPDGRLGSVTLFVTGHSYADAGQFSTDTTLIDMRRGEAIANLEDFSVTDRQGRQVTAVDVNFWGVTFSAKDPDRLYATMATGGKTYLIEGRISDRTARVLHENVECPSLSPDETRIAYKSRTGSSTRPWRLTVLDLGTMEETPLAETRSVDDQAEWLDDDRVLYGVDGDVMVVPADGSGAPETYIADGDSPAAIRW